MCKCSWKFPRKYDWLKSSDRSPKHLKICIAPTSDRAKALESTQWLKIERIYKTLDVQKIWRQEHYGWNDTCSWRSTNGEDCHQNLRLPPSTSGNSSSSGSLNTIGLEDVENTWRRLVHMSAKLNRDVPGNDPGATTSERLWKISKFGIIMTHTKSFNSVIL